MKANEAKLVWNEARALYEHLFGTAKVRGGMCLLWASVAQHVLNARGYKAIVQAGTLYWRIMPPEQDDGVCMTHFSYEWSPEEMNSMLNMAGGGIPEMHAWVAFLDEGGWNIADLTTGWLKSEATDRFGYPWRTADPPDYILGKPPEGASYVPVRDAVRYALTVLPEAVMNALNENKLVEGGS
jgi:hypothetical protein